MATNKRSEQERNHPSEVIYQEPAGQTANKARYGSNVESKQPNVNGDLPNKPGGTVRT